MEEWRAVVGCEGRYEVSNLGRIRSWRVGGFNSLRSVPLVLKPQAQRNGYVGVRIDGRWRSIHRLVLEAWAGPCPGRMAAHLNGRQTDNRVENLAWVTPRENEAHKSRHGTKLLGERCPSHRLTTTQVREIKARHATGERPSSIARAMRVNFRTLWDVVSGKSWTHV